MKPSVIAIIVAGGVIAGAVVYLNRPQFSPMPAPVVESSPVEKVTPAQPDEIAAPKPEAPKTIPAPADQPAQIPAASLAAIEAIPDDSTNSIHKLVDALLSAKKQKQAMLEQLAKSGQLDRAIAELKKRMADNPNDPEIPTTLGEAQLNEVRAIKEAGGDPNDMGILALQADQSFNAALKIDPANYEAQLVKAISQTFWPANPARDAQVVQSLSGLIDRQETMTPQPDFAQTYLYLGNEYQKIGQPEKALATWQLGLTKFPSNPALLGKINGQ